MIQGPPGTGKTTVIAAIAYSFVRQREKVLIVAHTNVASDNVTIKLADAGLQPVRVFGLSIEGANEDVAEFSSRAIAAARPGMSEIQVIQRADVVVTTTGCIGGSRFKDIAFRKVIIDEASQCVDPDIIQAIMRGCDQLVLAGDHNQLGPMSKCRACIDLKFTIPLMLRMVINGKRPAILTVQYRMHPSISAFASRCFYKGLIRDGITSADRTWPNPTIRWPNPDAPILFWDIDSIEEFSGSGTSLVNPREGLAVAELVAKFAESGMEGWELAIVTPYIGQMTYLLDSLVPLTKRDDDFTNTIEIDTVDAFQGREKEFIIFSCVRANPEKSIGFLSDTKRMNVALTRAKSGLIVVGNAATFAKNAAWASFIEYCQGIGALVTGPIDAWEPTEFVRDRGIAASHSDSDGDEDLA
jgi:regulator of nonsense transcripts 1